MPNQGDRVGVNALKARMRAGPAVRAEYEALAPEYAASRALIAGRDKSYDDSLTAALTDPAEAAAYIEATLDMDDPNTLLVALRQVAKAHGMAEVARRAELGEKTLFRALSDSGNPTVDTLHRVLHAVGLRLTVAPA